jgi:hypothetical protein
MMPMLAFMPLYDPLYALHPRMGEYWLWLAIPLVFMISVVYKGTRVESLKSLPREAAIMIGQLIVVMGVAAFILACGYWTYVHFAGPLIR